MTDHAVELGVLAGCVALPPGQAVQQLLADFGTDGAAREHELHAVDLGCLGQNGRAAMAHQNVHGRAQCGVGRDAREAVRAAAFQADLEVGGADGAALRLVGDGQHFFDGGNTGLDGDACAAHFLHHQGAQQLAFLEALRIHQCIDLVAFAAQTHDEHARQVGVSRIAGQGAAQHVEVLAGRGHAAAAALGKGGHAIHIGKGCQPLGREVGGDALDHGGRAVDRGQDADEVARAHAAARSHKSLESGAQLLGHVVHGPYVGTERGVAVVVHQLEVVAVHIVARLQVACGDADHRVVLLDLLALGDAACRDLVAGRHLGARAHSQLGNVLAQGQGGLGHQHIVVGVQVQQGRRGGEHLGVRGWRA